MSTIITAIDRHSPAERAGIQVGEQLLTINGHTIVDVLDYRFYGYDALSHVEVKTAAGQVRSEIVSRLKAAGLDAAEAYEDERFRERSGSVVAVGAKQAELAHAGLMNYLGEQYDAESGRTVEVYGRKLKMAASLDVYAPRRKGARGCEQTAEAVSEALLDGLADGLTLDELSWEKTEWDEEYGMFVRRGTARCTAYFVATADEESAVLTDFILKGVMQ